LGVKSPSEFTELSTAQMRKQFDMFSAQNKELCVLAQEVATEAAKLRQPGDILLAIPSRLIAREQRVTVPKSRTVSLSLILAGRDLML
jgi:hypothetical protein